MPNKVATQLYKYTQTIIYIVLFGFTKELITINIANNTKIFSG